MTRPLIPGSSDITFSFANDPRIAAMPSTALVIYPAAFQNGHEGASPMQMVAPPAKANGSSPAPPPAEADQPARVVRISQAPAQAKPNDPLAGMTAKMTFIDCIWISKEPAINKLLLLCISRFFKPNATTATMSYSRLAEDCGFSVRTGIRAAKEVRDRWLRIGVQKGHKTASGQNNLYVGTPPPELVEELRRRKAKGEVITPDDAIVEAAEDVTQSHALPEEDVTQSHALGARGDSVSSRGDRDDTLNTKEREEDSHAGADAPSVCATEKGFSGGAPGEPSPPQHGGALGKGDKPARRLKATEEQFNRFWQAYPKREGKAKARERFLALTREDAELAIAGAVAYAEQCRVKCTEPRYIKWPQGWLTERRFEDYTDALSPASTIDPEAALQRLAESEAGKGWITKLGPEKGMEKLRSILAASTKGAS